MRISALAISAVLLAPGLLGCPAFTAREPSDDQLAQPSELVPLTRAEGDVAAEPEAPPRPSRPVALPAPAQPTGDVVSASHVLIQYTGAVRASDQVTRTKQEAEARARDVAGRARAPGADFGALAREFSEDPGSGPRGGDLGTFGRGRMHPTFERVAFGLAVGETSDVFETPFGYHVVQRTR